MAASAVKGIFTKDNSGVADTVQGVTVGAGVQPKALLLWTTNQTTHDYAATGMVFSFGMTSGGGTEVNHGMADTDAADPTDSDRWLTNTKSLRVENTAGTLQWEADVAFTATGFNVTYTTHDTTAALVHYYAIYGDDITGVNLVSAQALTAGGPTQDITGFGFSPRLAIFLTSPFDTASSVSSDSGSFAIGITNGTAQGAVSLVAEDDRATADTWSYMNTDCCVYRQNTGDGTTDAKAAFSAWLADGVRISWSTFPSIASYIYVLGIRGGQHTIGSEGEATATGTDDVTVTGTPVGALFLSTTQALDASPVSRIRFSLGASDGTNHGSVWCGSDDGSAAGNSAVASSSTAVYQRFDNSTSNVVQSAFDVNAFAADTLTLEYSTAEANTSSFLYWTVASNAPAAPGGGIRRPLVKVGL